MIDDRLRHPALMGVPDTGTSGPRMLGREGALTFLGRSGCPVCWTVSEADRRYFFWFWSETKHDATLIDRLIDSGGMCPKHSRRSMASEEAPIGLASLYAPILRVALDRVDRPVSGACPVCQHVARAATTGFRTVSGALDDRTVADTYRAHGGICIPHLESHAVELRRDRLERVTSVLAGRLAAIDVDGSAADLLIGQDADTQLRRSLRLGLGAIDARLERAPTTIAALGAHTRVDACPICLAMGLTERRFLVWLAGRGGPEDMDRDSVASLCARHAHDLAALAPTTLPAILWARVTRWTHMLDRFTRDLAEIPVRRLERHRRAFSYARARLFSRSACAACRAVVGAERRRSSLILAAIDDRSFRDALDRSHGLCLRHVRTLGVSDRTRPIADRWRARAGVVLWELEEVGRKSAWMNRFEPSGPEVSGYLRVLGLLDGRVFLGGPAHRPAD